MWLRTRCELFYQIVQPTPFLFMLRARSGTHQWVAREAYNMAPTIPVVEITDKYGNLCQRMMAPVGDFRIITSATVLTSESSDVCLTANYISIPDLPDQTLEYLLPSRYCESDLSHQRAMAIVAGQELGYPQVQAITDWIRSEIEYLPGSSNVPISTVDIINKKQGVCRDLAHVGIALCRSLCIPARLVVGYLHGLQPMDIHAWFEAYVGGRWYTFDASQADLQGGRIAIAYGRDAADVAISNQFGPAVSPYHMLVKVDELEDFNPMD